MASLVALMAPNIRFSRRITRSPLLREASCSKLSSANEMFADTRSSIATICPSIEFGSRRDTSNTPMHCAIADQRQRSRRAHVVGHGTLAPGQRARIVQKIIADAYLAVAEGLSGNPGTLRRTGHDRNVDTAQARNIVAKTGGKAQQTGFRVEQENGDSQEVADRECGFADLRVQFFR